LQPSAFSRACCTRAARDPGGVCAGRRAARSPSHCAPIRRRPQTAEPQSSISGVIFLPPECIYAPYCRRRGFLDPCQRAVGPPPVFTRPQRSGGYAMPLSDVLNRCPIEPGVEPRFEYRPVGTTRPAGRRSRQDRRDASPFGCGEAEINRGRHAINTGYSAGEKGEI